MPTHRRADDHAGAPSEMPSDLSAVQRDDELLDLLGELDLTDRELARALAAHRREVRNDSDRELVDTDTALAAMRADVGAPLAAGVTLLVVVMMIGATLGVALAYLVTGLLGSLLWGLALGTTALLLAVGIVAYQEHRR